MGILRVKAGEISLCVKTGADRNPTIAQPDPSQIFHLKVWKGSIHFSIYVLQSAILKVQFL